MWNPGIPVCFDWDALEYCDEDGGCGERKYESADAVKEVVEAKAWEYTFVKQEDRGLDNEHGGTVKNFRGNGVLETFNILPRRNRL